MHKYILSDSLINNFDPRAASNDGIGNDDNDRDDEAEEQWEGDVGWCRCRLGLIVTKY